MARPRIDIRYRKLIAELAEQGLRPPDITRALEEVSAEEEWTVDPPDIRTVRRHYQAHMGKDPEQRQQYEPFRWPDSMLIAGTPWEASPVVLELLRQGHKAPTVGFMKWYWRVHLAAPDLPIQDKKSAADQMNDREPNPELFRVQMRAIETYLACGPWRETDQEARNLIWQELFEVNEITERCQNFFRHMIHIEFDSWLLLFVEAAEDSMDDRENGPGIPYPKLGQSEIIEGEKDGR